MMTLTSTNSHPDCEHCNERLGPGAFIPPGWTLANQMEVLELIDDEGHPNLAFTSRSRAYPYVPVMTALGMLEMAKDAALAVWKEDSDD